MKSSDIKYALFCIFVSLLFLLKLIPEYTPKSSIAGDISSAALPNAMMIIILICGIIMLGKGLFTIKRFGDGKRSETEAVHWRKLLVILGFIFVYLITMNIVGFYFITSIALPVLLKYYNREMKIWKILFSTFILLLFVFILFEMGLAVKMPRGFFI